MSERPVDDVTTTPASTTDATYAISGLRVMLHPTLGRYVITERAISRGETIAVWRGAEISTSDALALPPEERHQLLQVGIDRFLHTNEEDLCEVDFINHSCDPNCGFTSANTLVAIRSIAPGDSITFDYAMSDANSFIEFACNCGTSMCRGRLTGVDWQSGDLQVRYAGWFAPHVADLIGARTQK